MKVEDFVQAEETMPEAVYRFLEEKVLTEESTDFVIELVRKAIGKSKLRFVPFLSGIVLKYVDNLLPGKLLEIIRNLMDKQGLLSARRVHPSNPFR